MTKRPDEPSLADAAQDGCNPCRTGRAKTLITAALQHALPEAAKDLPQAAPGLREDVTDLLSEALQFCLHHRWKDAAAVTHRARTLADHYLEPLYQLPGKPPHTYRLPPEVHAAWQAIADTDFAVLTLAMAEDTASGAYVPPGEEPTLTPEDLTWHATNIAIITAAPLVARHPQACREAIDAVRTHCPHPGREKNALLAAQTKAATQQELYRSSGD